MTNHKQTYLATRKRGAMIGAVARLSRERATSRASDAGGAAFPAQVQSELTRESKRLRRLLNARFVTGLKAGRQIFQVVIYNPDWIAEFDQLSEQTARSMKWWLQRTGRRVARHGRTTMAGMIAIEGADGPDDEHPGWRPSLRLLVCVDAPRDYKVGRMLRDTMRPKGSEGPSSTRAGVKATKIADPAKIARALRRMNDFATSPPLEDEPSQPRNGRDGEPGPGSSGTSALSLKRRANELKRLVRSIGTGGIWVFYGLHRAGDEISETRQRVRVERQTLYVLNGLFGDD